MRDLERFVFEIVRLKEIKEKHEVMFHVVIKCPVWHNCLLAALRTIIYKGLVVENLFSQFRIEVYIHRVPDFKYPFMFAMGTFNLFFVYFRHILKV